MIKLLKYLVLAAVALLLTACHSGHGNGGAVATPANLRFVNAAPDVSLTVTLNGAAAFSDTAASSATGYAQVTAGSYVVTVTSTSTSLVSPAVTLALATDQTYSLLAYVRDGAVIITLINENQTVPPAGFATLGVSNASPDSGALDVFVVAPGTTNLAGLAPTFQSTAFRAAPISTTLVAGTFDMILTAAGNPTDVRLVVPSVVVTGGEILTLAFTSTTGGALVSGVLLNQTGATFVPTTSARVRVVSALPIAGASQVSATVGSTSLASVFAPNPGIYTLVTGGTTAYSVTAAGTAVATLPAATFAAGGDYTILVYGTAGAPIVEVLTDNNQAPSVGGNANLRLVNAGVNVAGGLTLYDNSVQVASSVGYGTASPYFGVVASSSSILELIQPSVTPVSTTKALTAGSVYTVFVIDTTLTMYVIRDR